jgi:hypothetical protein
MQSFTPHPPRCGSRSRTQRGFAPSASGGVSPFRTLFLAKSFRPLDSGLSGAGGPAPAGAIRERTLGKRFGENFIPPLVQRQDRSWLRDLPEHSRQPASPLLPSLRQRCRPMDHWAELGIASISAIVCPQWKRRIPSPGRCRRATVPARGLTAQRRLGLRPAYTTTP